MNGIVHLVEDDPLVREATRVLDQHGYATRLHASGAELVQQPSLEAGCVLLDLRERETPGLQVLEELARGGSAIPVVILTARSDVVTAVQALRLGSVDLIHQPHGESDLIAAIERAMAGLGHDARREAARAAALALVHRLSGREIQVLRGLIAGMTNKEMARRLDLSPRTVEMHRSSMMADLAVGTAAEAIRIGLDADLTPLGEKSWATPRGLAFMAAPGRGDEAGGLSPRTALARLLPPASDLLEGSADCVLMLDDALDVVYLNHHARDACGGDARPGGHVASFFPAIREAPAWEQLQRAAAGQTIVDFEFQASDSGRWYRVGARPVSTGLLFSWRDCTLDRGADLAIRMNEERLRFALEASGDGAWDWDVLQGHFYMSRRLVERLGYGDAPVAARAADLWRLVHPVDRAFLRAGLRAQLAGREEAFMWEYRIRTRQGEWRWNLDRGRVVSIDPGSGAATRLVGTSTDISSLKSTADQEAEANARIRLAFEAAGAGLWECDGDLRTVRLCPRSRALLGFSGEAPDEIGFETWCERLHPLDRDPTVHALQAALRSDAPFSVRFRAIRPDGDVGWVLATGRAVPADDGGPGRLVGLTLGNALPDGAVRRGLRQSDLLQLGRIGAMGTMAMALADELNRIAFSLEPTHGRRRREGEGEAAGDTPLWPTSADRGRGPDRKVGATRRVRRLA